jgi:biopolymer transport protein ExbD
MPLKAEPVKFRPRRRPALELGMTPLIDIVFLLLIFFMLTSSFVVNEGIQVDLPITESPHSIPGEDSVVITVRPDGTILLRGKLMTSLELGEWLERQGEDVLRRPFEIRSDRRASIQTVVSLLEMLRNKGASRVMLKTTSSRI